MLITFDRIRRAVLLLGGNKSGQWVEWYREAIPQADRIDTEYLAELRAVRLIP